MWLIIAVAVVEIKTYQWKFLITYNKMIEIKWLTYCWILISQYKKYMKRSRINGMVIYISWALIKALL